MLLLAAVLGCYWLRYAEVARTHVELLTSIAEKMEAVFTARGAFHPQDLAEYRYPYERARDFSRIVESRFGEAESYRRFQRLLERYAELLETANRLTGPGEDGGPELAAAVAAVRRQGVEVLQALD